MIITCPKCSVRYALDAEALGQEGRKLKCSKCAHFWFQTPAENLPHQLEPMQNEEKQDDRISNDTKNIKSVVIINGWVIFLLLLMLSLMTLFLARFQISAVMPGTIQIYETLGFDVTPIGYGLKITDVKAEQKIEADNKFYFIVQGAVVNLTDEMKDIPNLKCILYDKNGLELHSWQFVPEKSDIEKNSQVMFSSRIENQYLESKGFQIIFVD